MNVPDLRNVDFDAYRQRAVDLRNEAIAATFDRALAAASALLKPRATVTLAQRRPAGGQCMA